MQPVELFAGRVRSVGLDKGAAQPVGLRLDGDFQLAGRVEQGSHRRFEPFADRLGQVFCRGFTPSAFAVFSRAQQRLQHIVARVAGLDGCRPALPKPAHGVGEHFRAVPDAVAAAVPVGNLLVACEIECRFQQQVLLPPFAEEGIPGVFHSVLEEDAQRLGFVFAHQRRIFVAAPHGDIGADGAIDAVEQVRAVPGGREGGDAAAAGAADGPVIRVVRQAHPPAVGRDEGLDHRQDFFFEEAGERPVRPVEFVAAVIAQHAPVGIVRNPRLHEYADRHRHLARSDQIVQNRRGIEQNAIQSHQHARRRLPVVLYRHIDFPFPPGLGINRRILKLAAHHKPLQRIRHRPERRIFRILRIMPHLLRPDDSRRKQNQQTDYRKTFFHG